MSARTVHEIRAAVNGRAYAETDDYRVLLREIDRLTEANRQLTERLAEAQAASEGWYRAEHDRTGGPRLDKLRPAGRLTAECFPPGQRSAWRLLQGTRPVGGEQW